MGGRLEGKVVLVTGAASGMGRVATRLFTSHGAQVVAADVNANGLDTVLAELDEPSRAAVHPVVGNVTSAMDVERMIGEGVERFGKLNVLYNNAGIMPEADTSVIGTSEETWDTVLDVNLKSIFLVCKHGVPALQEAGGGSIINIASFVAIVGCTNPQDAYTASKGGVTALTRSLAVQYGPEGIRANAICPGPVLTPMSEQLFPNEAEKMKRLNRIPLGRFGRAEDIVNAASSWRRTNRRG